MNAVKKLMEVDKKKSISVTGLPFRAGCRVEVIVLPVDEDVFDAMDAVVKKKRIASRSMEEIETIVHEARGVR